MPPEVTFAEMYRDYQATDSYQNQSCGYEIFRQQCRHLHISNAKLGHEECEYCLLSTDPVQKAIHKNKADRARAEYQADKVRELEDDEAVYTLDLQKIVCLPR